MSVRVKRWRGSGAPGWGVIPSMPCTVRLLKVSEGELKAYEADELDRLVEEAEKLGREHLIVVLLGADAGLRRGEILGLNQADIDYKRQQLYVQRQVYKGKEGPTKNGKPRYVPMTNRLAKALRAHRHLRGDRVLYFKEQASNRWHGEWRAVTPKVLRMWMAGVEKRAGFKPRGALHILRHTFCSRLAMKNAPVMTIKELAGHQRIETTLRCNRPTTAVLDAVYDVAGAQFCGSSRSISSAGVESRRVSTSVR